MKQHLRIGSRGSPLALYQAVLVQTKLEETFPLLSLEIIKIKTKGDMIRRGGISSIGRGIFTREIEEALLAREIDFAVHSAKDLETELPKGIVIGAVLEREDARDALLTKGGRKLKDLPLQARIGTSSLRRKSQLKRLRPDLAVSDIRGNIESRIQKLEKGEFDGIVMAMAGLHRLGLTNLASEAFDESIFLPQAAQGTIAIQVLESETELKEMVSSINHKGTFKITDAERHFLRTLHGGCQIPVGISTRVEQEKIYMEGAVFSLDGKTEIKDRMSGSMENAKEIGISLAKRLLESGGRELLEEIRKVLDGK